MTINHHKPQQTANERLAVSSSALAQNRSAGFTLVELMVSLVLGLLISAAALQIFYTSSVNEQRQEASSQIQDNATFGWSQIQQHIRRANYGAKPTPASNTDQYYMTHLTPQGGVVLTAPTGTTVPDTTVKTWLDGNLSGLVLDGSAISSDLLTTNESAESRSNVEGVDNSDQLTIQYQVSEAGAFNCQGTSVPQGFYVIERYFVRAEGLACASAIYEYDQNTAGSSTGIDISTFKDPDETDSTPNTLDGNGSIVIPNVDYFRVLLGISSSVDFATDPDNARIAYVPIPADPSTLGSNRIFAVQIGILARSSNPTATSQSNDALRFNILDKTNSALNETAAEGATNLRTVYESTVLIRNARGGV